MISIEELSAIVKSLIISNQNVTTIEQLQKEFRQSEGYNIPLYNYASLQDLLKNGLSSSVQVYGYGPHAIVQAIVNSKTQHVYDLVSQQRAVRTKKRPHKKRYRGQQYVSNQINRYFSQTYSSSYRGFSAKPLPKYDGENRAFNENDYGRSMSGNYFKVQTSQSSQSQENWRNTTTHKNSSASNFKTTERRAAYHNNTNGNNNKWTTNKQHNNEEWSAKLNNNVDANDSGHGSSVKAKVSSYCQSLTSSTDVYKVDSNNKQTASSAAESDYKEYDYDCDEAVPEFACHNHHMLLENLRNYQTEILNESSKSIEIENVSCVHEFEKSLNISATSQDYLEELDEFVPNEDTCKADSFTNTNDDPNLNIDANKYQNHCEQKSSTENLSQEHISVDDSQCSVHNVLNSSLPSLIFSVKEQNLEQDSEEAVPDFAINNRVFSLDFPDNTVPFGQKIEPFSLPDDVQVNSIISIYISEVHNPYRFWYHYAVEELDELMHNIELFYAQDAVAQCYKMLPEQIQRGQICVALYNDAWHRAEILSGIIGDKVKVYYLDYGTVGDVATDELLYLNIEFAQQRAFACRGSLAEISPIRLHWSTEATTAFFTMVKNRKLHAKVCEIDLKNRVYYMQVIDSHTENIIHINRELIKMKHATISYDWIRSKLTDTLRLRHKREDYPTFDLLEDGDYPTFADIYHMEVNGINYEDMTDKLIYHPSSVNINNLYDSSFLLLSNNPFKEEIEKQMLNQTIEECK